jgi:TMEM175 potassium channel family protein
MHKGRIEAFSDGVIAIIITIMVLELKIPHGESLSTLAALRDVFMSYVLSFVLVGIYWNNHHHTFQAARHVSGRVLWTNLHLLFWLSLVPFVTGWMGENHFASLPVAAYGIVMLMAGVAYYFLVHALIACHEQGSPLATAIGSDRKGKVSVLLYVLGIPFAFYQEWIALALYVGVAVMWLIPDRRIEKTIAPRPLG